MKVSYFDIIDALHRNERFEDVQKAFEVLQKITKCSTGCGGCHDKVMDIVADNMYK
jgi:NAD(P)H-nitrite reductase large subunit